MKISPTSSSPARIERSAGIATLDTALVIGALVVGLLPSIALDDPRWGPVAVILSCAAAAGLVRQRGRKWSEFGLFRPSSFVRMFLLAIAAWFAISIIIGALIVPVLTHFNSAPDLSAAEFVRGNTWALISTLLVAWTTAAFGEEVLFRGFILTRLAEGLGGTRMAWVMALVGQAILFGVSHSYQGLPGVLVATAVGILLGATYLVAKRNIWTAVLAHGLVDTVSLIALYLGLYTTSQGST